MPSRRSCRRTSCGNDSLADRFRIAEGHCSYQLFHGDGFEWLAKAAPNSVHAVVTDPPYGLVEYTERELEKRRKARGGVWRMPPAFDGCQRMSLPRFTVLNPQQRSEPRAFFKRLAKRLLPVLVPGAHVFIATNPLVSCLVYEPFMAAGLEKRGEIIRVVYTLRGGGRRHERSFRH
jgi:DNA modification methylase